MQITWHGLNCLRLQGKEASVVIDPYKEKEGPKLPRWQADIVAVSSDELDASKGGSDAFLVETPGEYEVKGVFVYGLAWKHEKKQGRSTLFRVNIDEISVGHLGGLDRVLPNDQLGTLEGVDILCLPVGDPELLSSKDAVEVVSRIEPRIVIPMSFEAKGFKKKLNPLDPFIKELGHKAESIDKLKVTRKDLPEEERLVYQLELS